MELPKHIKDKISGIVKHNNAIIQLMNKIDSWNPELDKPIKCLKEQWQWRLYFTGQYKTINYKEIETTILTALTGKIIKPKYPKENTITLEQIRERESR